MSATPPVEWGQRVERLFEADADFWNDVYGGADVFSAVIQRRHATAAGWVDQLSLAPTVPVLEIGCGAGALAVELAQRPMTVCAVDSVHAMVALTRRRAAAAGVQQHLQVDLGDTHALEFADSTFGLVIALGVLPWLHSPARAVNEMARVLKPGGWLILSSDNRDCLVDRLDPLRNPLLAPIKRAVKRALKRPDPPVAWVPRGDRRRDTDQMLAGAGFRKIHGLTCGFGPLTLFHRRVVPHRLGAALERGCQRLAERGVPWIRSAGWHYMVLARKEHA
ncbi:MAG TPA: methyltransferase domain-containing protein [Candidatus Limnocylindria bacterium]|nr:methyltransferase domain-containing protein [Candidatus Limnocylindria bacterium]